MGTISLSDSLPAAIHFTCRAYRMALYSTPVLCGGGPPQFRTSLSLHAAPHTPEGSSALLFQVLHAKPWPSPFVPRLGPLLSCKFLQVTINDAAGFTLCYGLQSCLAQHIIELSTGLQPPTFIDDCLLATGQLGLYPDRTCTG